MPQHGKKTGLKNAVGIVLVVVVELGSRIAHGPVNQLDCGARQHKTAKECPGEKEEERKVGRQRQLVNLVSIPGERVIQVWRQTCRL